MTDVIEGTVAGEEDATPAEVAAAAPAESVAPPPASTELAVRPISHEVIRPLEVESVRSAMVEHQALLRAILDPTDWQGQPDRDGSFVKKSGWRKIATAYNLTLEPVSELVERDDDGMPLRATSTWRATAPNGRSMAANGHCAYAESRFSGPRGNTSKLENDLRATAETRAKNRAISDLIGMGKVSAEEVDAGSATAEPALPLGEAASAELCAKAGQAAAYLGDHGEGPDANVAAAIMGRIRSDTSTEEADQYVPKAAARALLWAALELRTAIEADDGDGDHDGTTPATPPAEPEPEPEDATVVPDDAGEPGEQQELG